MVPQRNHRPALPNAGGEMLVLALLFAAALGLGLLGNALRPRPLPLRYQSKAQRLTAAVADVAGKAGEQKLSPPDQTQRVNAEELRAMLARDTPIVVDARAELFFRAGHLPGALSLPREHFRSAYEQHHATLEADPGKLIVVYCQSAACEDSALVAAALRDLGRTNIVVLGGGWNEWQARGFPIQREDGH